MKFSPFKYRLFIASLLATLLAIAFYDVVFLNKTLKVSLSNSQAVPGGVYGQEKNKPAFIPVNGTDAPVMEEPIFEFIRRNFWKGILPLWNPHQACGYPLIAMIEIGLFYPLSIILYLLPSIYSWDVLILMRLLLAGILTFWMMRTLKFKTAPSLGAAIAFMLSGPMVLLQYWTANVDILTPLLIIGYEWLIRKPKGVQAGLLALFIGLTFFGGHPEHILLVNAYGFCFLLVRCFSLRKKIDAGRIAGLTLLSMVLGISLSAVVLFPFIQNFLTELWHGHHGGTGLLMEEIRERAITLALPHFFQKAPVTYQWVFAGWWGGYLGTFPLALAFLSLWGVQKKGLNFFFAGIGIFIIAKEYGVPLINWVGYLPFFNLIRYAIHTPPLAAFSIAAAAGMGIRAMMIRPSLFRQGLYFSLTLAVITIIHLIVLRGADHFSFSIKAAGYGLALLIIFQALLFLKEKNFLPKKILSALLVAMVFLELFSYIHRERPPRFNSYAAVPYIEVLKTSTKPIRSYGNFWAFYPNAATGFGVDDLGFFMGLAPKRFVEFVNTLLVTDLFKDNLRSPALRAIPVVGREDFLNLLNVRYIILPKDDRLMQPFQHFGNYTQHLKEVYSKEVRIYERPNALSRAFVVYHAIVEPNPKKALQLVKQLGPALSRIAVVNKPVPLPKSSFLDTDVPAWTDIKMESYTPNRVMITTNAVKPGLLVLSDAYHPDWKSYLDGKKVPLYQTDYLIRSVFLPAGKHTIVFRFEPFWFYAGCVVSFLALALIVFLTTGWHPVKGASSKINTP
ncbi:MAG TPA: YfhO family protein [Candidatus Bathyarchaeia archaeon]|nr:YfhO family protein [Candidatus Bathyarchaeia archaeon]